jgi:hydrogenase expression/formation protein HypC
MCLALPARVIEVRDELNAVVELGGVHKSISLALVDGIRPGDFVIVHVGYALTRLDPDQAEATLERMGDTQAPRENLA